MSAFECWEEQRESLRAALKDQTSVADQVYAIRHALMQTEQNTLAQQSDEVLRQQMGVLFSLVKGSVSFLETPVAVTSTTVRPATSSRYRTSVATGKCRRRRCALRLTGAGGPEMAGGNEQRDRRGDHPPPMLGKMAS